MADLTDRATSGADSIEGGDEDDTIVGLGGNDTLAGRSGRDSIDGGAGNDTVSGGAESDELNGGAGEDTLSGGDGFDILIGLDGADVLDGGTGGADAWYFESPAPVDVDLTRAVQSGGHAEGDTLVGVSNLAGSGFADTLTGNGDGNFINTGGGADLLAGGGGDDVFGSGLEEFDGVRITDFGPGDAIAVFDSSAPELTLTVTDDGTDTTLSIAADDGRSATVTLDGVLEGIVLTEPEPGEALIRLPRTVGGPGRDRLTGTDGPDTLEGLGDFDTLIGLGGADLLDGGAGGADAWYFESPAPVDVDLTRATQFGGDAEGDTLFAIDALAGSGFADTLTGNGDGNFFNGDGGADLLTGGGGEDGFGSDIENLDGDRITDFGPGDVVEVFGLPAEELTVAGTDDGAITTLEIAADDGRTATLTLDGVLGPFTVFSDSGDNANITLARTDGTEGRDDLIGTAGPDTLEGLGGNDALTGFGGADLLDGGPGFDDARYLGSPAPVDVDLDRAVQSGGHAEGDTLVSIERVSGSNLDDTLAGTAGGDSLRPNLGTDLMTGRGGDDAFLSSLPGLDGDRITDFSPGDRIVVYGIPADEITVAASDNGFVTTLDIFSDTGPFATMTLDGVLEGFQVAQDFGPEDTRIFLPRTTGGDGNDELIGTTGPDTLAGLGGDDRLVGLGGGDLLDGGDGFDAADYIESPAPVDIDLGRDAQGGGHAEGDKLVSIERLDGSAFDDTLRGDDANNFLSGRDGADLLDGGGGFDSADYQGSPDPVDIDLGAPDQLGGWAEGDILIDIENVEGSDGDDTLAGGGDDGAFIRGNFGADRMTGRGEFTTFGGELGEFDGDRITDFGAGDRIVVFGVTAAEISLSASDDGTDTTLEILADDGRVATLTLNGLFEGFEDEATGFGDTPIVAVSTTGTPGDDRLTGTPEADTIEGFEGNDRILAGDGNDLVDGGPGNDRIEGGAGQDTLLGGAQNDSLFGGSGADSIEGGAGIDSVDYDGAVQGVDVDLNRAVQFGGEAEGDTLVSVENLFGGDGADTLTGLQDRGTFIDSDPGADLLTGGGRFNSFGGSLSDLDGDRITDFGPTDQISLFGTPPEDLSLTVSDDASNTLLQIVRSGGEMARTALDGLFDGFRLESDGSGGSRIVAVSTTGTPGDDRLTGTPEADTIEGFGGNDQLIGLGGGDLLDGGEGYDRVEYQRSPAPVDIDLGRAAQIGGHAEGDTLRAIEQVDGSPGDDTLTGTGLFESFNGGPGADLITGGEDSDNFGGALGEFDGDTLAAAEPGGNGFSPTDQIGVFGGSFDAPVSVTRMPDGDDTRLVLSDGTTTSEIFVEGELPYLEGFADQFGTLILSNELVVAAVRDETRTISGETLTFVNARIGVPQSGLAPTEGTLTLTGSGTRVETVSPAGSVGAGRVEIGNNDFEGLGRVVVTDGAELVAGSEEQVPRDYRSGEIQLGAYGRGELIVEDGGRVSARGLGAFSSGTRVEVREDGELRIRSNYATPYQDVDIDFGATLDVSGAGARFLVEGYGGAGDRGASRLAIGRNDAGTARVEEGGYLAAFFLQAGRYGSGGLAIDGPGSRLVMDSRFGTFRNYDFDANEYLDEDDSAAFAILGRENGSSGTLSITNGGVASITNFEDADGDLPPTDFAPGMRLARRPGSEGELEVLGEGSRLKIIQLGSAADDGGPFLEIGGSNDSRDPNEAGKGTARVADGGLVLLSGENAFLMVGERDTQLNPGEATSTLTITDGAADTDGDGAILPGRARVEAIGTGRGAYVDVGQEAGSDGRVTISGPGARLEVVTELTEAAAYDPAAYGAIVGVGRAGRGEIEILDGGSLLIDGGNARFPGIQVGRGESDGSVDAVGDLTVSGPGSRLEIASDRGFEDPGEGPAGTGSGGFQGGFLNVGRNAGSEGRLAITDGGQLVFSGEGAMTAAVGRQPGSTGIAEVTGAGSALDLGPRGYLGVGASFETFLADASGPQPGFIEADVGGDGTLSVRDGATVRGAEVFVGRAGVLAVDGATVAADVTLAGAEARLEPGGDGATGTARVTGDLAQLAGRLTFEVAAFGSGTAPAMADLLVIDGAADIAPEVIDFDLSAVTRFENGGTARFLSVSGGVDPALAEGIDLSGLALPDGVDAEVIRSADGTSLKLVLDGTAGGTVGVEGFLQSVPEGDTGAAEVSYTLARTGDPGEALTVDFAVEGVGANPADGADFAGGSLPSGTAAFEPGAETATVTLDVAGDTEVEPDEDFRLVLSNAMAGGEAIAIVNPEAPGRIVTDDEPATVSLDFSDTVSEGDAPGESALVFEVTRTGRTDGALTVDYAVEAGTMADPRLNADAADLADGLPQTGRVTLPDGAAVAEIVLPVAGDTEIEPREDIRLTLTGTDAPEAYAFGNREAGGTILNDDGRPPEIPEGLEADMFGDPHLVTLDGLAYDFQAVGEFTLIRSTSGAALDVQVRTAPVPGSDLASVITALAADMGGGSRLMIDAAAGPAVLVDGAPVDVPPSGVAPVAAGDGRVHFDGETYTIVFAGGEALTVKPGDGTLDVCVFLDPARAPGSVEGLLGNANGDVSDDFALGTGDPLPPDALTVDPVSGVPALDFDVLYGAFAESWRVAAPGSLFAYSGAPGDTGPEDYHDRDFPAGALSVDDLPAAARALGERAADAAGVTDPALRAAAILDVALTGNPAFAEGAAGVAAEPEAETGPSGAPTLDGMLGVVAGTPQTVEGDETLRFTLYRTGDASGALEAGYRIGGDVTARDLAPGTPLAGTVDLAPGRTAATLDIPLADDDRAEGAETLALSISAAEGIPVGAATARTEIVDDDVFGPVRPSDGVIRGTGRDDALASGAGAIYLPDAGANTFLISDAAAAGETAVLDAGAGDVVQLARGLEIVGFVLAPDALQLDLATGARVQVLNADLATFEPGGNVTTGAAGAELTLDAFSMQVLGAAVPAAGVVTGGAATVPEATGTDPVDPVAGPPAPPDGVIRGTERADTLLTGAGAIVLPRGGADTVLVSGAAAPGETGVVEGAPGDVIQLAGGLEIAEFTLTPTALALTLPTSAAVQILEADALLFEPGGNATTGGSGPTLDYAQFAKTVLGTPVPDDGVASGGGITIPDPTAALSADMADLTDVV